MKPKICRKILNGVALVGMGIAFLANIPALKPIRMGMIYGAAFLVIADVIFGLLFLRCPHCKKLLNFRWTSQSICHNCGGRLDA